jgi:hypothetical protein
MNTSREVEDAGASYVSTGHLPPPDQVRALVDEAYERFEAVAEGTVVRGG